MEGDEAKGNSKGKGVIGNGKGEQVGERGREREGEIRTMKRRKEEKGEKIEMGGW